MNNLSITKKSAFMHSKAVSLLVATVFLFNSTAYGVEFSNKSNLRIPLICGNTGEIDRLSKSLSTGVTNSKPSLQNSRTLQEVYLAKYKDICSVIEETTGIPVDSLEDIEIHGEYIVAKQQNGKSITINFDSSLLLPNDLKFYNALYCNQNNTTVVFQREGIEGNHPGRPSLANFAKFYKIINGRNERQVNAYLLKKPSILKLLADLNAREDLKQIRPVGQLIHRLFLFANRERNFEDFNFFIPGLELLKTRLQEIDPDLGKRVQSLYGDAKHKHSEFSPMLFIRKVERGEILKSLKILKREEIITRLTDERVFSDLAKTYCLNRGDLLAFDYERLLDLVNKLKEHDFINIFLVNSGAEASRMVIPANNDESLEFMRQLSLSNVVLFSGEICRFKKLNYKGSSFEDTDKFQAIGFFPGLGSRDAYRNLGSKLYDTGIPEIREIYIKAAEALGFFKNGVPDVTRVFMNDENLPSDSVEKQGFVGAAFVVHNLALHAYFKEQAKQNGNAVKFTAYTGESFGVLLAAIAGGALSISDGIKLARFFTPSLLATANEVINEPYHVIGIQADNMTKLVAEAKSKFGEDFEVHKIYSGSPQNQVNVYVAAHAMEEFKAFIIARFPNAVVQELKSSTKFIAHSQKMYKARSKLRQFIQEEGIVFKAPKVPIISNNNTGVFVTDVDVMQGVLAMANEPMHSENTIKICEQMDPDVIVEIGLGGKTQNLVKQNHIKTSFYEYTAVMPGKDEAIFTSFGLIQQFRTRLQSLKEGRRNIEKEDYDLLKNIFATSEQNEFARDFIFSFVSNFIKEEVLKEDRVFPRDFYRFLSFFQNTYLYVNILKLPLEKDSLVLHAVLKKRLLSQEPRKLDVELMVLNGDNTANVRTFLGYDYPESFSFSFAQTDMPFEDMARRTRQILRYQPVAREIYAEAVKELKLGNLNYFTNYKKDADDGKKAASALIYQYTMFRLMRLYRPSLMMQNFYYVQGADAVGVITALVVGGAISVPDGIRILWSLRSDAEDKASNLEELLNKIEITDAKIAVIHPRTGGIIKKRKDILDLIKTLPEQEFESNVVNFPFSSWVVSFDSTRKELLIGNDDRMVYVSQLDDIWRRNVNLDLDNAEDISTLWLTDENGRVFRFAEGRGVSTANIYPYINAGEMIVGFGEGGSESLTMFLENPPSKEIVVRKVLSERLITVRWDSNGTGVMMPPFTKAKRQALFLMDLPDQAKPLFPKAFNVQERDVPIPPNTPESKRFNGVYHEFEYDMDFIGGVEVSKFIRQYHPPPAVVARLYQEIFRVLRDNVHAHRRLTPVKPTLESSYFKKIEDRLALSKKTAPDVFNDILLKSDHLNINGKTYLNIVPLLKEFREHPEYLEILEPNYHSLVTGDTNTENIKITNINPILDAIRTGDISFTAEDLGIKFIDPRAIGFHVKGQDTGSDDSMYDNKPWHNSLGHYDLIHGEHFTMKVKGSDIVIDFDKENPYDASYNGLEKYFKEVMTQALGLDKPDSQFLEEDPYWIIRFAFIMGTHFTAMPPFHFKTELDGTMIDNYEHQKRPVAIYAEGIKWLNIALEMLEGKREEFLGVKVPELPYLTKISKPDSKLASNSNFMAVENLSNESRVFSSPWSRLVRGIALGQYPIDYDPKAADNIRSAFVELNKKISEIGHYNQFYSLLTELILDKNNPQINISSEEEEKRVESVIKELQRISHPLQYVTASSMLFDSFAKLGMSSSLLVNDKRDLVEDALLRCRLVISETGDSPDDMRQGRGVYDRVVTLAALFLSVGQLGLKEHLVDKHDYIQESLDLLDSIPSAFYKSRGAALLMSAIGVLGYKNYIFDNKRDYMKEIIDYMDKNFPNSSDDTTKIKSFFHPSYSVFTMLNTIAVLEKPEYLTYKRDWIDYAQRLMSNLKSSSFISMGHYYLMAMHNLGLTDKYVPNVEQLLEKMLDEMVNNSKPGPTNINVEGSYSLLSAFIYGRKDLIKDDVLKKELDALRLYPAGETWFNSAYGVSYVLMMFGLIGKLNLLFDPNADFEGKPPLFWVIDNFSKGARDEEKITLPYLHSALVDYALRMRGANKGDLPLFANLRFLKEEKTILVNKETLLKDSLNHLSNESRAFTSPWMRIVRGFALGQHPMDYNPDAADKIKSAIEILDNKVPSSNKYNTFSNLLTTFILDVNNQGIALSQEVINGKLVDIINVLRGIDDPFLRVDASSVLFGVFVKLGLDKSLLVTEKYNLIEESLEALEKIRIADDQKGSYEKLVSCANLFLSIGELGEKRYLTRDKDYIKEALDLTDRIPAVFFRGRGAAALFSVLGVLGYKDYIFGKERNYMAELFDYFDEKFAKADETAVFWEDIYDNTYPLLTMLNVIAVLDAPEYLTYKRDWLKEAQVFMSKILPDDGMNQNQYYLMALYNLGKLDEYIPDVEKYFKDAVDSYVKHGQVHQEQERLWVSMDDSYAVETAWLWNLTESIPDSIFDRMVNNFVTYRKGEPYLNAAYGLSYVFTMLGEAGKLDLLFESNSNYEGLAPFQWVVRNFSEDGESEKITLPYLGHALINLALRMRGQDKGEVELLTDVKFLKDITEEQQMSRLSEQERIGLVVDALSAKYKRSIGVIINPLEPLGGGFQSYNRPFKVTTDKGEFIVKREGISRLKSDIVTIAADTARKKRLNYVVEMIPNDKGELVTEIHGHYYSVQRCVYPEKEVVPATAEDKHWRAAIKTMVELHEALKNVHVGTEKISPPHDPRSYIYRKQYVDFYEKIESKQSQGQGLSHAEKLYAGLYPTILEQLDLLEQGLSPEIYNALPAQLIHADLRFKNMYFTKNDDLEHLFDFGHAGYAPRIRDFVGVFIYNTGKSFDYNRLVESVALYNAMSPNPLSDDEIKALPEVLRGTWLRFIRLFFWDSDEFGLEKLNNNIALFSNIKIKLEHLSSIPASFHELKSSEIFLSEVKDRIVEITAANSIQKMPVLNKALGNQI